ncbi:uncharacterized protein LOC117892094 isoform X1 [Drosophila subobscura]|uniref:uncharacterized protein LOC117892094 isoform X1 n=1 Tax=Drosophila subobscura TaxID=7241 RepID=UPI00155A4F37|nr:uncharacterized protein LOC117892094 isoform X1 [Drosophila subobscura]
MSSTRDALEAGTLLKFAEWNVDPGTSSLAFQLDLLHVSLFGDEEQADNNSDSSNTLLSQLTINYEESPDQMCVAKHSAQQFAFQLFTKAALTELKAYSIMEFSWMTQRDLGQGNFTQEIALMRQNYQRRMNASVRVLSQVMAGSGRVYWRCDPGKKKARVRGDLRSGYATPPGLRGERGQLGRGPVMLGHLWRLSGDSLQWLLQG